ncbi:MAG: hypothetical protein NW215_03525 [Hyphomicrobiales bacterium]|nr:hypothetical protein [Hyphomicrobiales bacterium]
MRIALIVICAWTGEALAEDAAHGQASRANLRAMLADPSHAHTPAAETPRQAAARQSAPPTALPRRFQRPRPE